MANDKKHKKKLDRKEKLKNRKISADAKAVDGKKSEKKHSALKFYLIALIVIAGSVFIFYNMNT